MRVFSLFLFVFFCANMSIGQINFFKLFSDSGDDFGEGVVQLDDSSYVITGSSSSFTNGPSQAFLLKLDSLGNYIWSKHYGGSESESGKRVLHKNNFGFFIAGLTNSYGSGAYDYYLAKTDESGNLEWEKSYGGTGWEKVHDAALTRDTGVMLVGESSSNATDNKDVFIVRTDINGDTLWTKTIGGAGDDFATSLCMYDDSMFVVAGQFFVEDSSLAKGFLMILSDAGDITWVDTIGVNGNYVINDICLDGNEIMGVGETNGPLTDEIDEFFIRMDLNGTLINQFNVNTPEDRAGQLITTYGIPGKRYIAYNYDDVWSQPGGADLAIGKYTSTLAWDANYFMVPFPSPDLAGEMIPTNDGGAIIVGRTNSEFINYNHIFVAKIGPNDAYPVTQAPHDVFNLVSLSEMESKSGIKVYPNPADNVITVEGIHNLTDVKSVSLMNFSGKLIQQMNTGIHEINVAELSQGVYFINIIHAKGSETVRLIVH